jgi:hypothetical protein
MTFEQRTLVDESGMIKTQMGAQYITKWPQKNGTLFTIPRRNSYQHSTFGWLHRSCTDLRSWRTTCLGEYQDN